MATKKKTIKKPALLCNKFYFESPEVSGFSVQAHVNGDCSCEICDSTSNVVEIDDCTFLCSKCIIGLAKIIK